MKYYSAITKKGPLIHITVILIDTMLRGENPGTKVHTMIPFLYKSRTIKLIDGDRSQYSGYHCGGRLWIGIGPRKPSGELRVF